MKLVVGFALLLICAVCRTTTGEDSRDTTVTKKLANLLEYLTLREELEEVQKEVSSLDIVQTKQNTPMPNVTVICEGEKGWLQCKQYKLLNIEDAYWRRDDHVTCAKVPAGLTTDRLCVTNKDNTLQKVKSQCKNEQACEVYASNIFFDDNSCGNVYKYLKVRYTCVPDEANAVDVLK